jgi:hypothetical protein
MKPPNVQSSFAHVRHYPKPGEVRPPPPTGTLLPDYRYYELIRRSRQLFFLRPKPRSEVFAGCYQPLLPSGSSRRYLYESFLRCFIPCPGCPSKCICLFLPSSHRPSPSKQWVGFQLLLHVYDFPWRTISWLQIFHNVEASEFARLPGRSYRYEFSRRAAETFTSGQNIHRHLCMHRIC